MKYRRFEVYWYDPEPSIGVEIKKVRPCVILSPDEINKHINSVIIVPLTSNIRPWRFRPVVELTGVQSSVMLDQMRAVDQSRLKTYIGTIQIADQKKIQAYLKTLFNL